MKGFHLVMANEIHTRVKMQSASHGMTMQAYVISAVLEKLRGDYEENELQRQSDGVYSKEKT
jgi:hypothetical protein